MLSINSLTIQLANRIILHDITLEVRPGEVLALIGPNGVGKSTLIRVASGILKPLRGRITIDDQDVHQLPIDLRARSIAVVPQAVRLPESFSVIDTVLMGRTAYLGWLGQEGDVELLQLVLRLLESAGIDDAECHINHAGVFRGIVQELSLEPAALERVKAEIDHKNTRALAARLEALGVGEETRERLAYRGKESHRVCACFPRSATRC